MIISKTPFRISFFGGGTDYPDWYETHGGTVLSTSINKYCYITCRPLPPFFSYNYRIRYTKQEHVKNIRDIKHPSVRECLLHLGVTQGIEMQHNADVPAMSGLGSSSSFTVGFLNALYALLGQHVSKEKLALDAIHVEQERIKENVGSQDQTVAAFGGFNRINFNGHHKISVHPVTLSQAKLNLLQDHLMLFFVGFPREASKIAAKQIKNIRSGRNVRELRAMMTIVDQATHVLNDSKDNLDDFGRLLHEAWQLKRGLTSSISNPVIDETYQTALSAGALGGKLLGAGGGGFMLFFVKPGQQSRIKERLKKLPHVPFRFENLGSQIIYYAPENSNFA